MKPKNRRNSRDLVVPDDYRSIQSAIDNSTSPNTIHVRPGTYHEQVTLRPGIKLIGENPETTIIDASGLSFAYTATLTCADNTTVSGLTITGGYRGINCDKVSPVIKICYIRGNEVEGIYLIDSNAVIRDCTITGNRYGIYVYYRSFPTITGCNISDNSYTGVTIIDGHPTISSCLIAGNGIYGIGEYTKNSDPKSVSKCYIYNPGAVDYWDEAEKNYNGAANNEIPEVSGCIAEDPRSVNKIDM